VIARFDLVVLFTVVADMVLKPTGDDAGVLVLMAVAVGATAAYCIWRFRSTDVPAAEPAR
jgi:hypothetical protein